MLKEPSYVECFMVKTPLVPLRQNHQTQILFVSLFCVIFFTQIFLIVPSKFNLNSNPFIVIDIRSEYGVLWIRDYVSFVRVGDIVLHRFKA